MYMCMPWMHLCIREVGDDIPSHHQTTVVHVVHRAVEIQHNIQAALWQEQQHAVIQCCFLCGNAADDGTSGIDVDR